MMNLEIIFNLACWLYYVIRLLKTCCYLSFFLYLRLPYCIYYYVSLSKRSLYLGIFQRSNYPVYFVVQCFHFILPKLMIILFPAYLIGHARFYCLIYGFSMFVQTYVSGTACFTFIAFSTTARNRLHKELRYVLPMLKIICR